jgi:hypothetical protein
MIRVGDKIRYRSCFGGGPVLEDVVTRIELCEQERGKYGTPVPAARLESKHFLVIGFEGAWAYGSQIVEVLP